MTINPPIPEHFACVRKSTGFPEEQIKNAVENVKKWLEKQPHLPNI
jgi:hypothetical protein